MRRQFMLIFVVLYLSGCAIGNRHNYQNVVADISASGSRQLAIAVLDQRPYIKDGDKEPEFVGIQRGGYGNPFDVRTESRRPLAVEMTDSISASLSRKGFKILPVIVPHTDTWELALAKLKGTGSERLILLTLNNWKADTMMGAALIYDANLSVFDAQGNTVATSIIQGRDDLGSSFWNAPGHAKTAVPAAFKVKLEELLNKPDIVSALQ